jgi:hypothetical protein
MAVNYMSTVHIPKYNVGTIRNKRYEYDETLVSDTNGNPLIIPENVNIIAVTVSATDSGSGKIQTTTNKLQDVINDNNLVWVDWDAGDVVGVIQDFAPPVTAIRLVRSSGTVRMMIVAGQGG